MIWFESSTMFEEECRFCLGILTKRWALSILSVFLIRAKLDSHPYTLHHPRSKPRNVLCRPLASCPLILSKTTVSGPLYLCPYVDSAPSVTSQALQVASIRWVPEPRLSCHDVPFWRAMWPSNCDEIKKESKVFTCGRKTSPFFVSLSYFLNHGGGMKRK